MSNPHAPLSRTKTALHGEISRPEPRTEEEAKSASKFRMVEAVMFSSALFTFQLFMIVIYAVWFDYLPDEEAFEEFEFLYNLFRDVNIMIFFGFGFLMTFLRRYGYSAVGYTLLVSSVVVQWSIILEAFFVSLDGNFERFGQRVPLGLFDVLDGLFAAGAVMISYGAVLGKVTPIQLLFMGIFEPIFYWLNIFIGAFQLEAFDIGGGFYIHTFGAYFGLAVTFFLTSKASKGHPDNASCYSSDLFSFAGTLFLWLLWPSFNAVIAADGIERLRAVINTFLSLAGATASTFCLSRIITKGRFDPVHVQNATLAGGVIMGVAAHLQLFPGTAIALGMIAGIVSTLGFEYMTPFLNNNLHIQDVAGVHNLHGMPGVLGGLVSVFASLAISQLDGPDEDSFPRGDWQPLIQAAVLGISIGIAVVSGAVCGICMLGLSYVNKLEHVDFYNDRWSWVLPSDYEHVVRDEEEPKAEGNARFAE